MHRARAFLIPVLVLTSAGSCAAQPVSAVVDELQRADASVATAVVGSGGGKIALPDGATVIVAAGTFAVPTAVSLRELPPPTNVRLPPGTVRVGKFYTIEPRLASPQTITVTFPYDPEMLPEGYDEGSVSIYVLRGDGRLSMAGSITADPTAESSGQHLDLDNNTASIRTRATSTYTLLAIGPPRQ